MRILVADIMKSLTVYKFSGNAEFKRLTMDVRDPNGLWCIEMAKVPYKGEANKEAWNVDDDENEPTDNDFYLTADFDQNLTLLQRQKKRVEYEEEYKAHSQGNALQVQSSTFIG